MTALSTLHRVLSLSVPTEISQLSFDLSLFPVWCLIKCLMCYMNNVWYQTSGFRYLISDVLCQVLLSCQMSDFRFLISDVCCEMSDFRRLLSDVWFQVSDIRRLMSGVLFQKSVVRRLFSGVWYQTSHVSCLISDIWCQVSDVIRLMSAFWYQTSDVRRLIPDVWCQMSSVWTIFCVPIDDFGSKSATVTEKSRFDDGEHSFHTAFYSFDFFLVKSLHYFLAENVGGTGLKATGNYKWNW